MMNGTGQPMVQTDIDYARLQESAEWSYKEMQRFREERTAAIRQLAGYHHSDSGSNDRVPINLIYLWVVIHMRALASRAPRGMVTSPHPILSGSASKLQTALDMLVRKNGIDLEWRDAIQNAMFGLGIARYGLRETGTVQVDDQKIRVGQPYCRSISLDDFVQDMEATRPNEQAYRGSCRFISKRQMQRAIESGEFVANDEIQLYDGGQDDEMSPRGERAANIDHREVNQRESYRDRYKVWEYHLPFDECETEDGQIVRGVDLTLPAGSSIPLRVRPYYGPDDGPFDLLDYTKLNDNTLPVSPITSVIDLHEIVNRLFNKATRQAENAKTNIGAMAASADDAERLKSAPDREVVMMRNDPKNIATMNFPGVDGPMVAFLMECRELFSYQSGNLDTIAGLGPQAQTLGQEEILASGANKKLADMHDASVGFMRSGYRKLGWYLWTDDLIDLPLTYQMELPGLMPLRAVARLRAGDMRGQFLEYNFDIEPYSAQDQTPQTQVASMMMIYNAMIPVMDRAEAQGQIFNAQGFTRALGKLLDNRYVEEMFVFKAPPRDGYPQPVGDIGAQKSPTTTRRYVRHNIPGSTQQGRDAAMKTMLLGKGQQDSAAASVGA